MNGKTRQVFNNTEIHQLPNLPILSTGHNYALYYNSVTERFTEAVERAVELAQPHVQDELRDENLYLLHNPDYDVFFG